MTWSLVLTLSAIAYAFKVAGLVIVGGRTLPAVVDRCLGLVPAALISALVINDTLSSAGALVIDARVVGVGVAAVAAWRKAPFVVVITLAAAVTAAARALGVLG
jgi:branched-subunit amino acid transport protein